MPYDSGIGSSFSLAVFPKKSIVVWLGLASSSSLFFFRWFTSLYLLEATFAFIPTLTLTISCSFKYYWTSLEEGSYESDSLRSESTYYSSSMLLKKGSTLGFFWKYSLPGMESWCSSTKFFPLALRFLGSLVRILTSLRFRSIFSTSPSFELTFCI